MSTIRRHGVAFHLIPTPGDDLWLEVIRESDGAVLVNELFRGEGEAAFAVRSTSSTSHSFERATVSGEICHETTAVICSPSWWSSGKAATPPRRQRRDFSAFASQ